MAQGKDHVSCHCDMCGSALIRQLFRWEFLPTDKDAQYNTKTRAIAVLNLLAFVWDFRFASDELHSLQLAYAHQDIPPARLEIIAFIDCHVQQSFDGLHVLSLHLSKIVQECKVRQRRNE